MKVNFKRIDSLYTEALIWSQISNKQSVSEMLKIAEQFSDKIDFLELLSYLRDIMKSPNWMTGLSTAEIKEVEEFVEKKGKEG